MNLRDTRTGPGAGLNLAGHSLAVLMLYHLHLSAFDHGRHGLVVPGLLDQPGETGVLVKETSLGERGL